MKKTNGKLPLKQGTRVRILDTPHNTNIQFGTIDSEKDDGYAVKIDDGKSSVIWAKRVEVVG